MLYASCKKLLIFSTSYSLFRTACPPFSLRHRLRSGVMSAIVRYPNNSPPPTCLRMCSLTSFQTAACVLGRNATLGPGKPSHLRFRPASKPIICPPRKFTAIELGLGKIDRCAIGRLGQV